MLAVDVVVVVVVDVVVVEVYRVLKSEVTHVGFLIVNCHFIYS